MKNFLNSFKKIKTSKPLRRSIVELASKSGDVGWQAAKPIGLATKTIALEGSKKIKQHARIKYTKYQLRKSNYTQENFYEKGAVTLESLVDALLVEQSGASAKVVRRLSTSLGTAGAGAGIFSIASLLGTASTGTAISTLSGAAFNSAALAWIGGSVLTGGWIVLGVGLLGGVTANYGSRKMLTKWVGKRRVIKKLDEEEKQFVETCLMLATAFRERAEHKIILDKISAKALNQNLSQDLKEQLSICIKKVQNWPNIPLARLKKCQNELVELFKFLNGMSNAPKRTKNNSSTGNSIMTGLISASLMKLMASELPPFSDREQLVLQALRRSKNSLAEANDFELSQYIQSLSAEQISGVKNNVKGIYHELSFQQKENLDGDEYIVELFEKTNHPGADIRIINTLNGDVSEVQLKATNYASYVREHNEKYENIDILSTSEVASLSPEWSSSGFDNETLTKETTSTFEILDEGPDSNIIESMGVAAMVALAANARAMLIGKKLSLKAKQKIIEDGAIAATIAGLVQLIL